MCLAIPLAETPFLCPCLGCRSPGGFLFILSGGRKTFTNPPRVYATLAAGSSSRLGLLTYSLPAVVSFHWAVSSVRVVLRLALCGL